MMMKKSKSKVKRELEYIINEDEVIVAIIRNWIKPKHAINLHDRLCEKIDWIQGQMNMYGKVIDIPRAMFFLGDDNIKTYTYSNLSFPVKSWHNSRKIYSDIEQIRNQIREDATLQKISGATLKYDSCSLNYYRNGSDTIAAHSDKEALGPMNAVVTISLGGSRTFVLKSKTKGPNGRYPKIETVLDNGDLVLMAGKCQELWTHSIPREDTYESRISLTYRLLKT